MLVAPVWRLSIQPMCEAYLVAIHPQVLRVLPAQTHPRWLCAAKSRRVGIAKGICLGYPRATRSTSAECDAALVHEFADIHQRKLCHWNRYGLGRVERQVNQNEKQMWLRRMSASTIIWQSCSRVVVGAQPNLAFALSGFPISSSTSAGRQNFGLMRITVLLVAVSTAVSSSAAPSNSTSIPTP